MMADPKEQPQTIEAKGSEFTARLPSAAKPEPPSSRADGARRLDIRRHQLAGAGRSIGLGCLCPTRSKIPVETNENQEAP